MSALFGRTPQLAAARRALDRTRAGCGGVVVVAGEPGIGKSRLLRAIADEAEAAGLRIGIGRAWEVGSAPALWPWAQALRGVGIELADLVGESSGEMASAQRLVAFERVRRRLAELAQAQAIALFVDDAHAADLASLELALHLARSITDSSVLLVVTTREAELRASPAHGELIAKLAREAVRVRLDRFDIDELGRWLASTGFDGDVAAIHGITEGNPLFVEEALRVGIDRFTQLAEGGVALLLDEHLARVSTAALATLGAAAVLGREAAISDVVAVAQCSGDDVDAHVQEGLRAGVLAPAAPGELAFAHVLLRDASYARLGHDARARLHARTAEVLAARGASSSIVAHHLLEAGSVIAAGVVAAGVIAAAQAAMHRHDADSALASIERARPRLGELDDATRLELELVTADAEMRAGRLAEGRARSSACAERAGARNDASALARAALTYGLELMSGALDPEMVRLLEQARAALPNAASTLRARVLARLGAAKTPPRSPEEAQESVALAREAITMARTLGDETTLLFCLRNGASAFGYMLSPTERGELLEELMAIARRRRDDLVLLQAAGFYCTHLAECGRVADAEREADRFCALIERMPLPAMAWRAPATRASMAALRGDFAEAEAQGVELLARARAHGVDNGLRAWALLQVSMACSRRTALAPEIERDVLAILGSVSQLAPWAACVHALAGRATQARAAAAAALAFPRGLPWLISLGECAALLRDAEMAATLHPLLSETRLKGRFFWGPAGVFPLGPTERVLGELALLMGREELARAHFDEAIRHCRELDATPLLELSLRARAQLDVPATTPSEPTVVDRVLLQREGEVWRVGSGLLVRHCKGLEYLHALVREPGREQHVLALVGSDEAASDAGELLDDRAKRAYRARVEELEDRLADAERNGDLPHAEAARAELAASAEQLAAAVGLGGRDRRAASNVERARINVQRRIKDALRRIRAEDAALARYLEATVHTGTYCVYQPV